MQCDFRSFETCRDCVQLKNCDSLAAEPRVPSRSICEMACEVQASGKCTPDWLGERCKDADLYDRMRDQPTYAGWESLCKEIEHKRRWLFDELPNVCTMGIWNDKTAALADYARRVNQPELPAKVQQLWN